MKVVAYKNQIMQVKKRICLYCDDFDRELKICMQTMKKTGKNHTCPFFEPIGQGGGE